MNRLRLHATGFLGGACLLAGCTGKPAAPASSTTAQPQPGGSRAEVAALLGVDPRPRQQSPAPARAPVKAAALQMDVYQITVPYGAISRSDEFWKRVDEDSVDPATYDLLLKNGIRVGVAPNVEWDYFKAIIDEYPAATQRGSASGYGGAGAMELSLAKDVLFQNLFLLTDRGFYGRSYDECENLLAVTFQPMPRRPEFARVKVCPVVRGLRKRYEVSGRGEEREIRYVNPEQLYDVNLEAEVKAGSFLVVAPSNQAQWPTSLGNTFLLKPGAAEQFELVLLLVPRLVSLEELPPVAPVPVPEGSGRKSGG